MQFRIFATLLINTILTWSCGKTLIPEKPSLTGNLRSLDTLPISEIDIPIKINLAPLYELAEKKVGVIYTSPGWPYDFVVENCDTRYMYKFRRGPLQMTPLGNAIQLQFTGYYLVVGSQRICSGVGSNRTSLSPWSPPCTCGLKEGERKVNVGFRAELGITPGFGIQTTITRLEPVPLDKCSVCFWGHDITQIVMDRLKSQLDDARKSMQDTLRTISLRPQFQQVWDMLNTTQSVYNLGFLQINPQKLRISNFTTYHDTLFLSLGLSARPIISQEKPVVTKTVVPDISDFNQRKGFNIFMDAFLDYDSLSNLLNAQMRNKRIDLDKIGKYVVIEQCQVYGASNERLIVKINFSGSDRGIFYLTGKPAYDPEKKLLLVKDLDFDIRTKDFMLKTANWLFSRKIINELQPYSKFDVSLYEASILSKINAELNREIKKGIVMNGNVKKVEIVKIYPFAEKLVVRFNSSGEVNVAVNAVEF